MTDLIEIRSRDGKTAYAKCFFIHPDNEAVLSGRVQIDGMTLGDLGSRLGGLDREVVTLTKGPRINLAASVTVEPVLGEDGIAPDVQKIDRHWLAVILEDRPLWKGALIPVPKGGKMILCRISSVEPSVSIGTMLTKISLVDENSVPAKKALASDLFPVA